MFSKETYGKQHTVRLIKVVDNGTKDQVIPNEQIRRIIQSAIQMGNPLIKDRDSFVVLGNDGLDESWFPTNSFKSAKEALFYVQQKQEEEFKYSDGGEISTTFHVFTMEGVHVPPAER